MPKMKTRRATAKRFKITGSGLLKRSHAYASHILTKKDRKRKRRLKSSAIVDSATEKAIHRQLPYL